MKDHITIQLDKPFQTLPIGEIVEFPIGMAELMIERKAAHVYEEPKRSARKDDANNRQRHNDHS